MVVWCQVQDIEPFGELLRWCRTTINGKQNAHATYTCIFSTYTWTFSTTYHHKTKGHTRYEQLQCMVPTKHGAKQGVLLTLLLAHLRYTPDTGGEQQRGADENEHLAFHRE